MEGSGCLEDLMKGQGWQEIVDPVASFDEFWLWVRDQNLTFLFENRGPMRVIHRNWFCMDNYHQCSRHNSYVCWCQ